MRLKAVLRLFDKWLTRGVRLSAAIARHRGEVKILKHWECNESQRRRWLRHCDRLLALKTRWFGESEAE